MLLKRRRPTFFSTKNRHANTFLQKKWPVKSFSMCFAQRRAETSDFTVSFSLSPCYQTVVRFFFPTRSPRLFGAGKNSNNKRCPGRYPLYARSTLGFYPQVQRPPEVHEQSPRPYIRFSNFLCNRVKLIFFQARSVDNFFFLG